ncbi:MAG: 2-amino-4-hydroxy-6-hydroxymethyldihydropteridine diphosphokinase [Chitinophagaceae bacterium]
MQYINKAYLLTGGNVGNRFFYLSQAVNIIQSLCGKVAAKSSLYETAPWGNTEQAAFLNQALELHTSFAAEDLMNFLLLIEEKMGRKRLKRYEPRIIDIDILLFNDEIINTFRLVVPHPELPNRKFVLLPLSEIAGNHQHPVLHKTMNQLLIECPDRLAVNKVTEQP